MFMSWVAPVSLLGSALLGEASASNAADAASSAANTSAGATDRATALQERMYNQTREDQAPWRNAGANALAQMQTYAPVPQFNFNYDQNADPGAAFRMSEGLKALDKSAAARGGLLSGNTLKGISRYSQDLASQEYNNAFNRGLTTYNANAGANTTGFNRLASLAGVGQTANQQIGAAGQNMANNVGNLEMTNAANIGGAGMAAANARSSAYGGISNMLGYGLANNLMGGFGSSSPYQNAALANNQYGSGNVYGFGGGGTIPAWNGEY